MAAGLRPDPLGELERSPRSLAAIGGLLLRGGEGKGREQREGRGQERRGGKGGVGKGREGKGREGKIGERKEGEGRPPMNVSWLYTGLCISNNL